MDLDWSVLKPVDIGGNFQAGYQMGQQLVQKAQLKSALSAYAMNPADPAAMHQLIAVSPETAITLQDKNYQAQKDALDYHKQLLAQHQDNILKGAEILREYNPTDQASYSQALHAAQAAGVDISEVPQEYNPTYVDGIVKTADALKPRTDVQDPGIIREFNTAKEQKLIPDSMGFQQYMQMARPGMTSPVTIPQGATVETPGAASLPHLRLNPKTGQWEPEGGAGGNAGGGFPG